MQLEQKPPGATWSWGWGPPLASVWWDDKIILEMVNSARPPAAPGADVLITVGSQEGEQMRSGATMLEEALKARTGALGYLWVQNLVHGGPTTIWMM